MKYFISLLLISISFSWSGAEIASGAYFIRATTASNVATQKVMLMK